MSLSLVDNIPGSSSNLSAMVLRCEHGVAVHDDQRRIDSRSTAATVDVLEGAWPGRVVMIEFHDRAIRAALVALHGVP